MGDHCNSVLGSISDYRRPLCKRDYRNLRVNEVEKEAVRMDMVMEVAPERRRRMEVAVMDEENDFHQRILTLEVVAAALQRSLESILKHR